MADYEVTAGDPPPNPDCTGVMVQIADYNGYPAYSWEAGGRTFYNYAVSVPKVGYRRMIGEVLGAAFGDLWSRGANIIDGPYPAVGYTTYTGTAVVAEYVPPVVGVLTNILLGATPEACRILDSRIVRGPV